MTHHPRDLAYQNADDLTNTVSFTAPSASQPGRVNTVTLAVLTGATTCDCRAADAGLLCWHRRVVAEAWELLSTRHEIRWMNPDQLARCARKADNMVTVYRRRTWRTLPDDRLRLVATRCEYRRRDTTEAKSHAA